MTERPRLARWRLAVAAGGGLMIVVALLADWLGLDHSPTFGTGETLLLLAGVTTLIVAALGQRAGDARRAAAVFLFDAVVLLLVVELGLIGLSTLSNTTFTGSRPASGVGLVDRLHGFYLDLPYYREQSWSATYWRENAEAGARLYQPFVTWRRGPYRGETITIDDDGFRVVPGARCDAPDAFRVDALGGSTMWGWGSPDDGTIPAHLQRLLSEHLDRPVCVRNLGETAYVSSQELVQWTLALRDDHATGRPRPDLAIFYDGVNDALAAHQAGRAGTHQNLAEVVGRLDAPRRPLATALGRLEIVRSVRRWLPAAAPTHPATTASGDLAREVVASYLGVVDTATRLAAGTSRTRVAFFWQPVLGVGDKPLTADERALVDGVLDWAQDPNPTPIDFFRQVYDEAAKVDDPRVIDLRDAFDATDELVWIDPWGHVTPTGNAIVARRMVDALAAVDILPTTEVDHD
ncbi:MAG: SGNH/GDSL hydrolase family protein [Acidobacteriota bacterium]